MTKPRYPRKRNWLNLLFSFSFFIWLISLTVLTIYSIYRIQDVKLQIDVPPEIVSVPPNIVYDDSLRAKLDVSNSTTLPIQRDPCNDIKRQYEIQLSSDKKLIVSYRNKLDMFMADLAFEIEIAKQGHIPVARVKDLLKKHDNTQRQIYNKVYQDKVKP